MEISRFKEKLNKVEGIIHVVEEEVHLPGGMYEAELQHDNIIEATFAVFTGPRLTGERLETYTISTPSMTPWKRIVRVYADVPVVYISYETDGDTVEAEDMNRVQEAVVVTQEALNAEEVRAGGEERRLDGRIDTETVRAEEAEQNLADGLASETTRAKAVEQSLTDGLATEVSRAGAAEKVLADDLATEVTRAGAAEKANTENITAEVARAKGAEKTLTDHLAEEIARAEASERILTDSLATEVSRAKAREGQLAGSIDAHTTTVAGEIQALKAADTALDEKKADSVHVNAELGKRYTKEQVYTKEEVLQKIEDLIGSAPDTLDTLREVADALGNDPNFAGTIMNALAGKVDKVAGKQLSANDYSDAEKAVVADVNTKKHTHGNKAVLDKLTQAMLDNLSAAYTHISDGVKHITAAERTSWTDAYQKRHEHGNKGILDGITQALLDKWTSAHTHISDGVKHITAAERTKWNTVTNKVDKVSGKQLSANDYTTAEKDRLAGIAAGAEVNVQSDWSVTDASLDAFIKNKPGSLPASDVAAWAKAATKPSYNWTEIGSKPGTFPPSSHSHAKSQITDMPTKLSQFSNDTGYLTATDVDTSQDHTHPNKSVLDKVTQALLDKLNGIAAGANKYVHPATAGNKHLPSGGVSGQILQWSADGTAAWGTDKDTVYTHPSTHPSSMITTDATHRFLTDFCKSITDWNSATTNGFYMASGGTNAPSTAWYFGRVIAHNSNYVYQEVYQFTASTDAKVVPKYIRCKMNGTWGSWTNVTVAVSVPAGAKFTDTVYTHPNSGITAKTYRSVTVNAQGHVTAGTNPTTLSGYGITDAATRTHSHDDTYLKKGPLTWGDLKGV